MIGFATGSGRLRKLKFCDVVSLANGLRALADVGLGTVTVPSVRT
jgi:hypothetical protein